MSNGMQGAVNEGRFSWVTEGFSWKEILAQHIFAQCYKLEKSLEETQKAYFQFRIHADRQ